MDGLLGTKTKSHRKSKSGAKVNKQKRKDYEKQKQDQPSLSEQRNNPKAFGVAKSGRARKNVQRNLDRSHRKEYVPQMKREQEIPPPITVVVMGPPGSGKSTLIRSLVKRYTRHNIGDIKGPVTVVSGKERRLTFFECPNDLNAMIDLAKIADLVLLLVDASFGFEMETFEFLNICQVTGFPKVMGILTHLDAFKKNKSLQKTKKRLKSRFWTEIYQGAKLFYFSGVTANKYPKGEIQNLSLYIARMKFRPLTWRNSHPYMLADRMEDVTHPDLIQQNPLVDRKITLYGYLRGTHLKPDMKMHIAGAGDFFMDSVTSMPDPCGIPGTNLGDNSKKTKKHLTDKEILLYAPMSDVGNVLFDKDAMYIHLSELHYTNPETNSELLIPDDDTKNQQFGKSKQNTRIGLGGEGVEMVQNLQNISVGLDERLNGASLSLFKNTQAIRADEIQDDDESMGEESVKSDEDNSDSESEDDSGGDNIRRSQPEEVVVTDAVTGRSRRRAVFLTPTQAEDKESGSDEDSENESSDESEDDENNDDESAEESNTFEDSQLKWKENLVARAAENFLAREQADVNLMTLVYGELEKSHLTEADIANELKDREKVGDKTMRDNSTDDGDLFFNIKRRHDPNAGVSVGIREDKWNALDCSRLRYSLEDLGNWQEPEILESLRDRFVTGSWKKQSQEPQDNDSDVDMDADPFNDNEMNGTFEDLETGEAFNKEYTSDTSQQEETDEHIRERLRAEKSAKSLTLEKSTEDDKKDADDDDIELMEEAKRLREAQALRNAQEFGDEGEDQRLRLEGFRNGLYVRIEVSGIPAEFVKYYDPTLPIILGGLPNVEQTMGFTRLRFKKHRWHPKILKSNDPLVFSIGWRRYQALPLYSIEDSNDRQRFLKYTPEHMHCCATVYGPLAPPNTGVLAFQSLSNSTQTFRVSGTGVVLELDHSFNVVKKLKLIGTPSKIHKHTVFVTGMFNSELEVAKFEGASIRTVSGIRGRVKKALRAGNGDFRATFEDKVLKSDIIFCRTWVPVEPKTLYNPVTSLLSGRQAIKAPQGVTRLMKTVYQLRKEKQLAVPVNPDSLYKPIERKERVFNTLRIPKKLQANLPFASKPKLDKERSKKSNSYLKNRTVALEPEEKKMISFMQQVNTVRKDRQATRKAKLTERHMLHAKRKAREEKKFEAVHREAKKAKYRAEGKEAARRLEKS